MTSLSLTSLFSSFLSNLFLSSVFIFTLLHSNAALASDLDQASEHADSQANSALDRQANSALDRQARLNKLLASNAPEWEPYSTDNALRLWTMPISGSDIRAFKAEQVLDASLASIFAVIANPFSCPDWVDGCISSKPLGGASFNQRIGYALNRLPWPFRNRQVVVQIQNEYLSKATEPSRPNGAQLNITMVTTQTAALPDTRDAISIKDSYSRYQLEALEDGRTKLTWIQHTEPGGALPDWLVNQKITDLPEKSIPRLEQLARKAPYDTAELVLDNNEKLVDIKFEQGDYLSKRYK